MESLSVKIKYIRYTLRHWVAYQKTAREIGQWRFRHLFHDLDKVYLYLRHDVQEGHKRHQMCRSHHMKYQNPSEVTEKSIIDAIIDWECARITKPDKPLDARQTLYKFYPKFESVFVPYLDKFSL